MKPKKSNSRPPVAGGGYLAVCVYSIGIGEQLHKYMDSTNYHNDVVIGWELYQMTYTENGQVKPYDISVTYNASMDSRAALRKMVEAWNGRPMTEEEADQFDTNDLVGRTCLLNVTLKENGYNGVAGVMQVPPGMPQPTATMPLITFDMEDFTEEAFSTLPEWAQKRIKKSTEYQKLHPSTEAIQPPTMAIQTPGIQNMQASVGVQQPPMAFVGQTQPMQQVLYQQPVTPQMAPQTNTSATQNPMTGGAPF